MQKLLQILLEIKQNFKQICKNCYPQCNEILRGHHRYVLVPGEHYNELQRTLQR